MQRIIFFAVEHKKSKDVHDEEAVIENIKFEEWHPLDLIKHLNAFKECIFNACILPCIFTSLLYP